MAITREVAMTQADWSEVNLVNVTHVTLQLKTTGPVLVQVATVKPSPASGDGIMVARGGLEELPLSGLVAGDVVWVRSFEDEDNRVASYQVT